MQPSTGPNTSRGATHGCGASTNTCSPTPAPSTVHYDGWSSGLFTYGGRPKVTDSAWRLPLHLPVISTKRGRNLEVWGCVRPPAFASSDGGGPQTAQVEFAVGSSSSFTPVRTVAIKPGAGNCYFDVRLRFPASGTVRLSWQYPALDPQLGNFAAVRARTIHSREVKIIVR